MLWQAILFTEDEPEVLNNKMIKLDSTVNPLQGNSFKDDLKYQLSRDATTTVGDSVKELPRSTTGTASRCLHFCSKNFRISKDSVIASSVAWEIWPVICVGSG